jgi:enoyl-CoA hydratase/carnithine racemase
MPTIIIEERGGIGIIRLHNGVTNAIGPAMVDELRAALSSAGRESRALIVAGGGKFFSMGFDLPLLLGMARGEFEGFFFRFNQAVSELLTLPLPTCCVIEGHAVAGGCIIALACDYRLAAAQRKIGLNEIRLGVPVPYLPELILRQTVGERAATDLLYSGDLISTGEAAGIGLVDAIHPTDTVVEAAIEKLRPLADHPPAAFAAIKSGRTASVLRRYEAGREPKDRAFVDCWYDRVARERLREAAGKFRAPESRS